MRINDANIPGVVTMAVVAFLLAGSPAAEADTIKTLSGETYDVTKVLKKEADGVTVKHTRGIAKIPSYELNEAARKKYGLNGKARPEIRHRSTPSAALLPDLPDVDGIEKPDATEVEPGVAAAEQEEEVTVTEDTGTNARTRTLTTKTATPREAVVRKVVEVKVSAIGCGSNKEVYYGPVTTKYTAYGNYSYYGTPGDYYLYFNPPPPCNRCYFERRDMRRWQGKGRKVSRFPFAHYPH